MTDIQWFPKYSHKPYPIVSGPSTGTGIYEIRQTGTGRFSTYRHDASGDHRLGLAETLDLAKQRAREEHDARLAKRVGAGRRHEYRIHFEGTDGEGPRNETAHADTAAGALSWRDDFLSRDGWRGDVTIARRDGHREKAR